MKITVCDFEQLPTWAVQQGLSSNGSGKEYANYILIEDEDRRVCYSDAMEPEDCKFTRDLSWIVTELRLLSGVDR